MIRFVILTFLLAFSVPAFSQDVEFVGIPPELQTVLDKTIGDLNELVGTLVAFEQELNSAQNTKIGLISIELEDVKLKVQELTDFKEQIHQLFHP